MSKILAKSYQTIAEKGKILLQFQIENEKALNKSLNWDELMQ